MANEYLQRTPTSTGNRKVFTWSAWIKRNSFSTFQIIFTAGNTNNVNETFLYFVDGNIRLFQSTGDGSGSAVWSTTNNSSIRDPSALFHLLISFDSTQAQSSDRVQIYVNGVNNEISGATYPSINYDAFVNSTVSHRISGRPNGIQNFGGQLSDVFLVDGQALTPDVFGFYKEGKGYISAGSTQATDFRPGQWVPKTPRVIKTEINRRGGFGVNGFYLPMNDSRNFGADFHCEPNSIITLNEKLPQPRVGVASTAAVGLGYTDVLRADPYAANLVLALPFVSSGLCTNGTNVGINTGFGDYSHIIRNSGVAKTTELYGSPGPSIGNTGLYYGSAANFGDAGGDDYILTAASSDFVYGSGDFTIETWWYPTSLTRQAIYHGSFGADYSIGIDFNSVGTNRLGIWASSNGSSWNLANADAGGNGICGAGVTTNQWHHLAYVRNGTNLSMYLNGVAVGIVTGISASIDVTATDKQAIGVWFNTTAMNEVSGYLQDFRIYKGVAKYKGGFDVPKPYTPVGIATWRAVPDTTANNFATWNPISRYSTESSLGLTNGNLTATADASVNKFGTATVGVTTGKWYYEFSSTSANSYFEIGIGTYAGSAASSNGLNYKCYSGNIEIENVSQTTVSSLGANEILGIAFNASDGQTTFYKNGVGIATISFTSSSGLYIPQLQSANGATHVGSANFGQNPTFSGNTTAGTFTDSNGKGLFKYQPPSGFLALCEDNLPTPAISDPGDYFKTVIWSGSGSSSDSKKIVGVGFTPDLVWTKARNQTYAHLIYDSVRGTGPQADLTSYTTGVEGSVNAEQYGFLSSFDSDGFSSAPGSTTPNAYFDQSGVTYTAWCWRAGAGTTSTNTDGSIQSVVSVSQTAGFSIVTFTATTGSGSIGHGLGKPPKMIVIKSRNNTSDWVVYHESLGAGKYLNMNKTDAAITNTSTWQNTTPTSTVFYSNGPFTTGWSEVAYCWAEIEGFSKAFSYVGNGSDDGPMVWLGFKPAVIIIKRTDAVSSWAMLDSSRSSTNPANRLMWSNLTDVEGEYTICDFLSNGIKLRNVSNGYNASGGTYVGMAFAESPFTTANAK